MQKDSNLELKHSCYSSNCIYLYFIITNLTCAIVKEYMLNFNDVNEERPSPQHFVYYYCVCVCVCACVCVCVCVCACMCVWRCACTILLHHTCTVDGVYVSQNECGTWDIACTCSYMYTCSVPVVSTCTVSREGSM